MCATSSAATPISSDACSGRCGSCIPPTCSKRFLRRIRCNAGEELARRERARLHLGDGESGDLMTLLDREGLKVYRPLFPEDTPLEGIFLFDAEVGPSLIVNGRLAPLEADFVFSRLYAHYLIDNDPYSIHLSGAGRRALGGRPARAGFRRRVPDPRGRPRHLLEGAALDPRLRGGRRHRDSARRLLRGRLSDALRAPAEPEPHPAGRYLTAPHRARIRAAGRP